MVDRPRMIPQLCHKNAAVWCVVALLTLQAGMLVFAQEPPNLEFDKVHVGQVARRELKISNDSEKPVTIKDVNSSCSCLRVVGVDRLIAPKTTGTLVVEYRPIQAGSAEVEILVETDRVGDPVKAFRWEGVVLPPIPKEVVDAATEGFKAFISSGELSDILRLNPNVLLADVRTPEQFNLSRIENAINLPLSMIGTLASSAKREVVLMGEGYDDQLLVREVLNLQKKGISSVRILRGGVRSWSLSRHAMLGTGTGTTKGALIEPSLLLSSSQDEWIVVAVSPASAAPRVPGSISLPFVPGEEKAFGAKLLRETELHPSASKALIVSPFGEEYEIVEKALPVELSIPVYYLSGGSLAYADFISRRGALQQRREIRLASGGGGNALLPSGAITAGRSAGCASCPKLGGKK